MVREKPFSGRIQAGCPRPNQVVNHPKIVPVAKSAIPRPACVFAQTLRRAGRGGFTLIELLVVLIILGLLAGLVLPRLLGRTEEAKRQTTEMQIRLLENALSIYYADNGFYPSTQQGLRALVEKPSTDPVPLKWKGPYLEKGILPQDPWDRDYIYLSPGVRLPEFDLLSYGKDGVQGGEGEFADIENWNISRK